MKGAEFVFLISGQLFKLKKREKTSKQDSRAAKHTFPANYALQKTRLNSKLRNNSSQLRSTGFSKYVFKAQKICISRKFWLICSVISNKRMLNCFSSSKLSPQRLLFKFRISKKPLFIEKLSRFAKQDFHNLSKTMPPISNCSLKKRKIAQNRINPLSAIFPARWDLSQNRFSCGTVLEHAC